MFLNLLSGALVGVGGSGFIGQGARARATSRPAGLLRSVLMISMFKSSGKSPTDMRSKPLKIKILLESNPLKSRESYGQLS